MRCQKCEICAMREMDLFSNLSEKEKDKVTEPAKPKDYKKNSIIFENGEVLDTVYLIRKGSIKLFKYTEDGKEVVLDTRKVGDVIGEINLFGSQEQLYNAMAIEDTFICECNRDDFLQLLNNPVISYKMIQMLVFKLNNNIDEVASILIDDVKERIVKKLNNIASENSVNVPEGRKLLVNLTHEEIGNLVNASRVMATKCINQLKEEGVIINKNRQFIIKD